MKPNGLKTMAVTNGVVGNRMPRWLVILMVPVAEKNQLSWQYDAYRDSVLTRDAVSALDQRAKPTMGISGLLSFRVAHL